MRLSDFLPWEGELLMGFPGGIDGPPPSPSPAEPRAPTEVPWECPWLDLGGEG